MIPPAQVNTTGSTSPAKHYDNLLEALVDQGNISQEKAVELLSKSVNEDKDLELIVKDSNLVTSEDLVKAKAAFYNVPYISWLIRVFSRKR